MRVEVNSSKPSKNTNLVCVAFVIYVDRLTFSGLSVTETVQINIISQRQHMQITATGRKLFGSLLLIARYIIKIVCIISENELEKPKTSILLCVSGGALQGMQDCSRQQPACAPRTEKKMYI